MEIFKSISGLKRKGPVYVDAQLATLDFLVDLFTYHGKPNREYPIKKLFAGKRLFLLESNFYSTFSSTMRKEI